MLSIFPKLLDYSLFAPFLIRITLACVLYHFSKKNTDISKYKKIINPLLVIASLLLIIGLFTQAVALVVGIYLAYLIYKKIQAKAFLTSGVNYYLILFVLCLTLLIAGAGRFSIDLPL
ncbi:MAG: hypothetical protein EXS50_02720 [Candidatus Taylorbacteria bacterium]|nr:hypothetical protein [Candidatus Taylorbacteria bacterium]